MFSNTLRNMNTTYIQNNFYGSSSTPSYSPCNSFMNMRGCSIFGMPMPMSMPNYGFMPTFTAPFNFGGAMMPPMLPFGGGCGCNSFGGFWGSGFLNMFMSLQLLQSSMKAFSNISKNFTSLMNFSMNPISSSSSSYRVSTNSSSSGNSYSINTKTNLPQLSSIGYNASKGSSLAKAALSNTCGFTGYCAKYVRVALESSGLSNGMRADGADYGEVLSRNRNFREISASGINLSSLPAGCILVYGRGVSGYSSRYGHVEITTGNGQAVSDGVTNNIRPGARIFVPV